MYLARLATYICHQTHLASLCFHRCHPRHQCQLNHVVGQGLTPPPPNSSSNTTRPDSLGTESCAQDQRSLALSEQGLARAIPVLMLGEVKAHSSLGNSVGLSFWPGQIQELDWKVRTCRQGRLEQQKQCSFSLAFPGAPHLAVGTKWLGWFPCLGLLIHTGGDSPVSIPICLLVFV